MPYPREVREGQRDRDEKGRGRQEAAPGSRLGPAAPTRPGSYSRPSGQIEALKKVWALGRGWALRVRPSWLFEFVRGHFISLSLCPQLSNRKVLRSLPHWAEELTK